MPESNSDSNNANYFPDEQGEALIASETGASRERANEKVNQAADKTVGKPAKSRALKIAGALSMVLWTIGFVLPFILKKESPYVWVSDTFLLIGFWPLLFYNKAGWTWLVFGILNMVLGFGLELIKWLVPNIPESFWTPEKMAYKSWFMNMHHHITDMHPCLPWILIGAVSTIYGVFRVSKTIVKWSIKKFK